MPSKKRDAVERMVRRERKRANAEAGEWLPTLEYTNATLRALIAEVRRETARECAEIADWAVLPRRKPIRPTWIGDKIRERFNLEE